MFLSRLFSLFIFKFFEISLYSFNNLIKRERKIAKQVVLVEIQEHEHTSRGQVRRRISQHNQRECR